MTRILVVEDDPGIREALQRGFEYQRYIVDGAADAATALALAQERVPDVVVLDLMLPDSDGLDVCRHLRSMGDPGIVMLTARDRLQDRIRGLDAGADDYVVKPFAFEELLARIRAVLRRKQAKNPESLNIGDLHLDLVAHEVRRGARSIDLTPTEYTLLEYLATNSGRVMKRDRILEQVWGYNFDGESDVLKVAVSHLRSKINGPEEPDFIHTVRGFGYVMREPR